MIEQSLKIIELNISTSDYSQAMVNDKNMGALHHSITNGEGNIAGFVGEIIVANYLKAKRVNQSQVNYDYDLDFNGKKIDVKTKRTTENRVLLHYEASIADYNPNQKCDIYVFTRVNLDLNKCWIVGWLSKKQYFKKARFLQKGQVDGTNHFIVQADCYNVKYSEMKSIQDLKMPAGLYNYF